MPATTTLNSTSTQTLSQQPTRQEPNVPVEKDSLDEKNEPIPNEASPKSEADKAWDVDPVNPRNWSLGRKWRSVAIVSMYTFVRYGYRVFQRIRLSHALPVPWRQR